MPDKYDQYRRNAQMAQEHADKARGELDRNSWLRLARDWLDLIPKLDRRPEDEARDDRGR